MDDDDGPRTAQPPAVTYPAIMRAYLRGDAPGTITPVKVDNWHAAAAVKLHDAITRHGLGAVVFPQTADKSPLAKYEGRRDNCKWPAADALRAYEWRTGGAHLLEGRDAEAVCETSKSQRFPAPLGTETSKFRSGAARRKE